MNLRHHFVTLIISYQHIIELLS